MIELLLKIFFVIKTENKKYDAVWFMPELDRKTLYDRINARVDIMMEMGLYQEFQRNMERYPSSLVIKNTIGYREFIENEDINVAVEKIKQHTRNFAKRQMTWFRGMERRGFAINWIKWDVSGDEFVRQVLALQ